MAPTAPSTKEKPAKKTRPQKGKEMMKESKNEDEIPLKKKKTTAVKAATTKQIKKKIIKNEPEPLAESENGTTAKKQTAKSKKKQKTDETEKSEELPGTSKPKEKITKGKKTKKVITEEVDDVEPVPSVKTKRRKKEIAEEVDETETVPSEPDTNKPPVKKTQKRKAQKTESKEPEPEKKVKTAARSNATVTDWDKINFNCISKTSAGKTSNFHITSWNVDGIRAWIKKGGLDLLKYDEPNIFCVQETKCSQEKLPDELKNIDGYEAFWCSSDKEGYAGVGLLTKIQPINVIYGIDSKEHDEEGRCITAEFENFYIVNVYVPNAGRKLVTLPKRLEWNECFKIFIKKLDEKKPVIVCGDMNVAHTEIDLANPKTNRKNAGFTVEEREGLTDFLEDGYTDTFRQLYPEREKAYTFWTYMANSRSKNVGWRLDYFIVSERFMKNICDNVILHEVLGSDHCPITLHISI